MLRGRVVYTGAFHSHKLTVCGTKQEKNVKKEKKACQACVKQERKHLKKLCNLGERINHLEENIVALVNLLDESQLRNFVIKRIIV